jgi:hypothetical protein
MRPLMPNMGKECKEYYIYVEEAVSTKSEMLCFCSKQIATYKANHQINCGGYKQVAVHYNTISYLPFFRNTREGPIEIVSKLNVLIQESYCTLSDSRGSHSSLDEI